MKTKQLVVLTMVSMMILFLGAGAQRAFSADAASNPKEVIAGAVTSVPDVKGVSFDFTTTLNLAQLTSDQKEEIADTFGSKISKVTFGATGSYDMSDENDPKMLIKYSLMAGPLKGVFELRLVDEAIYLQLTKAPRIDEISFLKDFERKWVLLPENDFEGEDQLTDVQKEHIIEMAHDANLLTIVDTHPSQKVGGVDTYPISFDLNRPGIVAFLENVESYLKTANPSLYFESDLTVDDLNEIQNFKGKVWVGKKDGLPYKASMEFTFMPEEGSNGKIKVTTTGMFKNWNKPVRISAPSKFVPIEELMEDVLGGAMLDDDSFDDIPTIQF